MSVEVNSTGLTLLENFHYIGATADSITGNKILEIKCPYSEQNKTVKELVLSGYKYLSMVNNNEEFVLNKTSPYYYQVQGEMAIKGIKLCHFIVWTPYDSQIIPMEYDMNFWEAELLLKLISFFPTFIEPVLLSSS